MAAPMPLPRGTGTRTPLSAYQWKLLGFLGLATLFEGYDFFALAQILPALSAEMKLNEANEGALVGVASVGTILAFPLIRQADRWGRRRVLRLTIAGYSLCSLLTALAPDAVSFALLQLLSRVFLIGEWAVALIYAAEEFPADRRGLVMGVVQACASVGAVICAAIVPLLLRTGPGWRSVYLVGTAPIVLALMAGWLHESRRFTTQSSETPRFLDLLRSPWGGRMLLLALLWGLTYVCTQNAVTFWKLHALRDLRLDEQQVGTMISLAALVSMPLMFATGALLDRYGRKPGAAVIYVLFAVGVVGAYKLPPGWELNLALTLAIYGAAAVIPVLNAYTTELFPTELRSGAFAWSNNVLGRLGFVLSPFAVGAAAGSIGWSSAVAGTAIFPLLALALILLTLPETRGRELEDTSRI